MLDRLNKLRVLRITFPGPVLGFQCRYWLDSIAKVRDALDRAYIAIRGGRDLTDDFHRRVGQGVEERLAVNGVRCRISTKRV